MVRLASDPIFATTAGAFSFSLTGVMLCERIHYRLERRSMSASSFLESAVIDGDILTIRPRGDLDTVSAPEFDQAVQEHLDAGHSKIIVDCQRMGTSPASVLARWSPFKLG